MFGSAWLAYLNGLTFAQALAEGVIPYVGFDLIKIVLIAIIGTELKKCLIKANLVTAREA